MYDARTKLADQVVNEVREHFGDKVLQDGRPPHRCGCRRRRRSGSRSSRSIRRSRGAIAYRDVAKEVHDGAAQRTG